MSAIRGEGDDLVIPFASRHVWRAKKAVFDSVLRIHGLRSWSIRDTEQVETYDFDEVTFDGDTNCVRIKANIPLFIEVNVERFSVTLETPG